MTGIIGLDLSTACCGVADALGRCHSVKPAAGAQDPARRLHQLVDGLEHYMIVGGPKIAVVEAFMPGARGRTAFIIGEVHGAVKLRLFENGLSFVEVKPNVLKKYATGKGNAGKDDMIRAARDAGATVEDDDQADAWWLRQWGLENLDG